MTTHYCTIHRTQAGPIVDGRYKGEKRIAVVRDLEEGWLCEECAREIGQSRSDARSHDSKYAYACGER